MSQTLNQYMKDANRLIRDPRFEQINPKDLLEWINVARREVAMRAQCCRVLTNSSGAIESWTVTAGGTGYVSPPTVTVTAPDFPSGAPPLPNGSQATAIASVSGGSVVSVVSTYGGAGYFLPQVTFTGGSGTGAAATPFLSPINVLVKGQEVYPFSAVDLTQNPGAGEVYYVRSISVLYANYRYSLPVYDFSVYQAKIRQYPAGQYQYVPTMASQFGQGASGSFYVYPLPSQTYQFELDMLVLPQDLITDLSVEIIPNPWCDAVKYFVAHLVMLSWSNYNAATYYEEEFDKRLLRYSQYARIGRTINQYGRY